MEDSLSWSRVGDLAAKLFLRKQSGSPYVLLLGAGASLSSGVPPTYRIQEELLKEYGHDLTTGDLAERFDKLWQRSSPEFRGMLLTPFLAEQARKPSVGYEALARLIQAGYFGLIVTFNFDDLVEQALGRIGFTQFKIVIRGETDLKAITTLVNQPVGPFTLLKLHGSLRSTDTFLFSYMEMARYPRELEEVVKKLTGRPIIVCGYAFNDRCMQVAFSDEGEDVVCVNPNGVPPNLRSVLSLRRSSELLIDGELGYFDTFFTALEKRLQDLETKPVRPRLNPFKFLDSYDVADRDWFFGRKRLTRRVLKSITAVGGRSPSLHLIGAEKAGKTSFVRAGLIAHLDSKAFEWIYLRCRSDLESQIQETGGLRLGRDPTTVTLDDALNALASPCGERHTVLVLDQFERVLKSHLTDDRLWQRLPPLFRSLAEHGRPRLTVVFVSVDPEGKYYKLIVDARLDLNLLVQSRFEVRPLRPLLVAAIVYRAAKRSDFSLHPEAVRALIRKFADPAKNFTLAHLQAICYLLVKNAWLTEKDFRENIHPNLENALNAAINASDFLNYVEDLPLREGRHLLRSLMQVVSEPSKEKIASFLKEHFADLLQAAVYPEPL